MLKSHTYTALTFTVVCGCFHFTYNERLDPTAIISLPHARQVFLLLGVVLSLAVHEPGISQNQ